MEVVGEKFNFSDFSTFKANGKTQSTDQLIAHLKQIDKEGITHHSKLQIGDEVKIKGIDYTVIVKHTDFEVPGVGKVDYAGIRTDGKDKSLRLFNQKDIEEVLPKSNNKENDGLER